MELLLDFILNSNIFFVRKSESKFHGGSSTHIAARLLLDLKTDSFYIKFHSTNLLCPGVHLADHQGQGAGGMDHSTHCQHRQDCQNTLGPCMGLHWCNPGPCSYWHNGQHPLSLFYVWRLYKHVCICIIFVLSAAYLMPILLVSTRWQSMLR